MKRFFEFFDDAAELMASLSLLIIIFFFFMVYRFYEIQTLFAKWLPIEGDSKLIASYAIAIVVVFTTLIFMVNAHKLAPIKMEDFTWDWSKLVLVVFALIINLFFWEIWSGDRNAVAFKCFASVMLSTMDYGFAHLFNELRKDRANRKEYFTIVRDINKQSDYLSGLKSQAKELRQFIDEHQKLRDEVTCPHCQQLFTSKQALSPHVGKCHKNPKNV